MIDIPKVIVTEDQWLAKGLEKFAQSGTDGMVIEKMATELGCSKSSFYWYFKNRHEFIMRLVDFWAQRSTQQVIRKSSIPEKAEEQISEMLAQMFSATRKGDFLFYLRKLVKENASFQATLETIERKRLLYARELFEKTGMSPQAAEQKSFILYHYYLGWYERHKDEHINEEDLHRHIEMLKDNLLRT
ncbi:TetR/AcrR family transcriptional regulator [Paenibacillus sp. TRM 82003]|nr:TetR/AcrR family transcriptional regulator [Paenibacillus sp. TRM 82003]